MNKYFLFFSSLIFSMAFAYAGNFSRSTTQELREFAQAKRYRIGKIEGSMLTHVCCNKSFAPTKVFKIEGERIVDCGEVSKSPSRELIDAVAAGNYVYYPDLYWAEYNAYRILVGALLLGTEDSNKKQLISHLQISSKADSSLPQ
jgi:hypothetical protein